MQERGHGRDGELLRDFILKREHLKEDSMFSEQVELANSYLFAGRLQILTGRLGKRRLTGFRG